jgi:two-component system, OmpR family, response regulator QseB
MRILIVEDDSRIHQSLTEDLRRQHHAVDVVENGVAGLGFARMEVHDVILLDILLPGIDGLELCRRVRSMTSNALILMITARDDVRDKVAALDAGADDYIVKPFDLAELSARIRAVSRRQGAMRSPVLEHGGLRLDPLSQSALSPREREVIRLIAQGLSNGAIARLLERSENTIKNHIRHIFAKTHCTARSQAAVHAIRAGLAS